MPSRLLFFFAVTGGSYLGKPGALFGAERGTGKLVVGMGGAREACCNSLVFTWGFLEMVFWFWVSEDFSLPSVTASCMWKVWMVPWSKLLTGCRCSLRCEMRGRR